MYLEFFDLQQAPFSITPDPEFVYLSEKHQESLAHLIYGVTRGGGAGFVQLTGEVGTGKTTISRLFLQKLPDNTQAALILNPNITPIELLENIFKEFKISTRGMKGKLNAMVEKLNEQLLQWWGEGKNTLVIIDEAQNIPRDTLEQLRLLTNLETDQQKLLQIILIGQPELKQLMLRKDLRQLSQRITSRFHLQPLSKSETQQYIKHRVAVSGGAKNLFSDAAINLVFKQTEGIPRLINVLCDRALLVAFAKESSTISNKHVNQAITEIYPDQKNHAHKWPYAVIAVMLISLLLYFIDFKAPKVEAIEVDNNTSTNQTVENVLGVKLSLPSVAVSWQKYLALWDADPSLVWNENRCPDISTIGMGCLRKQGNLTQIERQNTPVLLELDQGQLALVTKINPTTVNLLTSVGEQAYTHSQINQQWYGHYFILWPVASELIDDTISSTVNSWALSVAKVIDNNPNLQPKDLSDWITSFQYRNGLLADGIIGKETQMALSLKAYKGPNITE